MDYRDWFNLIVDEHSVRGFIPIKVSLECGMSDRLDPDSLNIDYRSVEKKAGFNIYRGRYKGSPVLVVVNIFKY